MPTRESQRGERNVIASFTGSQPTIHAFRHRQAVPIGAPLVNKNLRPGCTVFSLSSSPPFVSLLPPLLCVASCLSLLCPPLSACLLQSAALIIITIIASFFPSSLLALTFTPPLNFLSLRQLHSLSLSLAPSLPCSYTSNQAGSRAASLGVVAAAEYQIEGKTRRQKKRGRARAVR